MEKQARRKARLTTQLPKGWVAYHGEFKFFMCPNCNSRRMEMVGWREDAKKRWEPREMWQCKKCGVLSAMNIWWLMTEMNRSTGAKRMGWMPRFF